MNEQAKAAARDAAITAAIGCAIELVVLACLIRPLWLEHAKWRLGQWHGRRTADVPAGALAEVRRDISRFEHGDTMPAGGRPEPGLYGGLR